MSHLSVATSVDLQNVSKTAGEKMWHGRQQTVGFYDRWHTSTKVAVSQNENCAVKRDYGGISFLLKWYVAFQWTTLNYLHWKSASVGGEGKIEYKKIQTCKNCTVMRARTHTHTNIPNKLIHSWDTHKQPCFQFPVAHTVIQTHTLAKWQVPITKSTIKNIPSL